MFKGLSDKSSKNFIIQRGLFKDTLFLTKADQGK